MLDGAPDMPGRHLWMANCQDDTRIMSDAKCYQNTKTLNPPDQYRTDTDTLK